ncbi:predicted protein [Streptomyces viridosporus ATCC 14672]|uniref:Predicted protein n=1 Tax=Streptomyces viridosporus (strain ATCC 14672 / DSM 40746 / JCM 4963 / KCTC 9882 / NRRL B-12104 / FH 1290) TaxID=566461 RepID=D5ZTC4_STRV1|nr:predicted protein [Streptomyces viridosporus ATCC 14672]
MSLLLPFTDTFSWATTERYNCDPSKGSCLKVVYEKGPSGDNIDLVGCQLHRVGESSEVPPPFRSTSPHPSARKPEGGNTVPVLALVSAVLVITLEQFVQWKYGVAGIIGLLLLTIGIKAKSPGVSSAGAVLLALLVARPAL